MTRIDSPAPQAVAPDEPSASEHAAVAAWVEEAFKADDGSYRNIDVKAIPGGDRLLAGNPEQSRRVVMAALGQVLRLDRLALDIKSKAKSEFETWNPQTLPGWNEVWVRRRGAFAIISTLMKRSLPFDKSDLLTLVNWCVDSDNLSSYYFPIGPLTRSLQRHKAERPCDPELRDAMKKFAERLRSSHDKDAKRNATAIEQLCSDGETAESASPESPVDPAPQPASAGSPAVLDALKRAFGMLPKEPVPVTTEMGPDLFPLCDDSPLRVEHELISLLLNEVVQERHRAPMFQLISYSAGKKLAQSPPEELGRLLLATIERHTNTLMHADAAGVWQAHHATGDIAVALMTGDFFVDRNSFFDLLLYFSILPAFQRSVFDFPNSKLIALATLKAAESPLTEGERYVLSLFRASLVTGPALGVAAEDVQALTKLINDGASFYLAPGEAWTDAVNVDISRLQPSLRTAWTALFHQVLTATSPRPSAKWLKTARQRIEAIGNDCVCGSLLHWFPLVSRGRSIRKLGAYSGDTRGGSDTMNEENANCLRGLLWCMPLLPRREELGRAVTAVALSAYKKVPGVGPRAVKVGNAAVYALSELASKEAVGQLAMLKVRVRFGTAQKEIEKAFNSAAAALELPRDQIEELGVPSYGMEDVGRHSETIGGYCADLNVTGCVATLNWFDAAGKPLKSVPAKVKSEFKDDWKDLQQSLKDIQAMLPAQRDRIDGMFLLQKTWPIVEWRERYHDHPLVGTIARRLLWRLNGEAALFNDGIPTGVSGKPIAHADSASIALWHPVDCSIDEITAWRSRLEELQITQPFKQAHRELYLLTDAERNTRTYSNRFAAHVVGQHQFNALCAARGWKNKLRLMVDDSYPPASKELPQWGMRAEYWIEGIGQDYGTDTNDAGTYLRLATDQVRFYRTGAAQNYAHAGGGGFASTAAGPGVADINEPLPLEDVPALVFTEIMRDVDLFVGVASIGNDPTWQDSGPQGAYREYWQSYAFGDLSGTAATRKQVLERLVPRLKIASRCSFSDRFLVVRGDKRTYKIHLGSGNILMAPNDQYLCIVPDARARAKDGDLYLPFEGDSVLSIIISKALLLADDTRIKDPTIVLQIDRP